MLNLDEKQNIKDDFIRKRFFIIIIIIIIIIKIIMPTLMVLPSTTLDSTLRCSITQKPKPTDLTYVDKHISARIRIKTKRLLFFILGYVFIIIIN